MRLGSPTPKTDAGHRDVPLDPALVSILRAWRAKSAAERLAIGELYEADMAGEGEDGRPVKVDLVFRDEIGRPVTPSRLRRVLDDVAKWAAIPGGLHPHRLRHAAATLMLAAVDRGDLALADVSAYLGHRDSTITVAVYGHSLPDGRRAAAGVIGRAVMGAK